MPSIATLFKDKFEEFQKTNEEPLPRIFSIAPTICDVLSKHAIEYNPDTVWKVHHAFLVMDFAITLYNHIMRLSGNDNTVEIVALSGLLHDIGRLVEFDRTKGLINCDHGEVGAALVWEIMGTYSTQCTKKQFSFSLDDIETLALLVQGHNRLDPHTFISKHISESDDLLRVLTYLLILQDADRYINFTTLLTPPWFERVHAGGISPIDITSHEASSAMIRRFKRAHYPLSRVFNSSLAQTLGDAVLCQLSWLGQFTYAYSYQLARSGDTVAYLASLLAQGPNTMNIYSFLKKELGFFA